MLLDLQVRDFVLIHRLDLGWDAGMTVLTGETGAGKSIVIDALTALLGGRVSPTEVVRSGADTALLEASFSLPTSAREILVDAGIDVSDDMVVISREISRHGRSRVRVNGKMATLGLLRRLGEVLLEIHGQHEHQSLLLASRQLEMLDAYGGEDLTKLAADVRRLARERQSIHRTLTDLRDGARERVRQLDLLRYQLDEIEAARLVDGEEEDLVAERTVLAHAEQLRESLGTAYAALYENETAAAVDLIGRAVASIGEAARYDPQCEGMLSALREVEALVAEQARSIRWRLDEVSADPERLGVLEARLSLIDGLKRKYGPSIDAIKSYAAQAQCELEGLDASEERLDSLVSRLAQIEADLLGGASQLHTKRVAVARDLETRVELELRDLGMDRARFRIDLRTTPGAGGLEWQGQRLDVGENGFDSCEFLFSANPGEELRPLANVASGGELSRIMLVLKAVLASVYDVPTLIFDEVDAGIGGRAAQAVAARLGALATTRQVICVTHLAQIAAEAGTHLRIEKQSDDATTQVELARLDADERVRELARMLDGTESVATLQHARQMLVRAKKGVS